MPIITLRSQGPELSQMLGIKGDILSTYTAVSKLLDVSGENKRLAGHFRAIASEAMLHILQDDDEDKISQQVGDKASNLARMNFFDHAADLALQQVKSKGDDKHALAIELLRAAAYFGSGNACQLLIQANEEGVIELSSNDICHLVEAQIFWHEDAQKLSSSVPAEQQTLPALINLKKAWAAVYKNTQLFNQLLDVAYLKSGITCQAMLDAYEKGTIALTNSQVRQLINQQIKLYREISELESRDKALVHAPKLLTQAEPWKTQPKIWVAIRENVQENFVLFRELNDFLTTQLPESERVATLEQLAATTEADPGRFVGYFEDSSTQKTIKDAAVSAENHQFNTLRKHVLLALIELRQDVAKKLVREIYDMRPKITAKHKANEVENEASKIRCINEKARLDKLDNADFEENPNPAETIKYIGEGKGGMRNLFDNTIGKVVIESRADFNKKQAKASVEDKGRYDARLTKCQEMYNAYLGRQEGRKQDLKSFENNEQAGCEQRAQELENLKADEMMLIANFHENNPLSFAVREVLIAMARDLAVYGTPTNDWLLLMARMIAEDAWAYRTGTTDLFGYEGTKGGKIKNERLPVFIAANEPAYLTLLQVFFDANQQALASKKDLPDFTTKAVLDAFLKKVQNEFLDVNGKIKAINPAKFLVKNFPLNEAAAKKDLREQETKDTVKKYTVRNRKDDPLLLAIESLKVVALSLTVTKLFSEAGDVIAYTNEHSTRLAKIVADMQSSSRLRNYLMMALVVMHHQATLHKLSNLQSADNPLNQYGVSAMDERVRFALETLENANYADISVADLNNAAIVLAYLQRELASVDEIGYVLEEGAVVRFEAEIAMYNKKGKGAYKENAEATGIKTIAVESRTQRAQLKQDAVFSLPKASPVAFSASPVPVPVASVETPQRRASAFSVTPPPLPAIPAPPVLATPVSSAKANAVTPPASPRQSPVSDDMSENSSTREVELQAQLLAQQAEMQAQKAAMEAQLQAQKAALEEQMQALQLAAEKARAQQAPAPQPAVIAATVSMMAVVLNKTTGGVSECEATSFVADDNNAMIGVGIPGSTQYVALKETAEQEGKRIIQRRKSMLEQLNKPKPVMQAVLVSKISTGKIEVIECAVSDSRTKDENNYQYIGSAELGIGTYQSLLNKAKGEVTRGTMLHGAAQRRGAHVDTDSDNGFSDDDKPAKKASPAPVPLVAPAQASESSEPKKLSMKERAALLGLGGTTPVAKPAVSASAPVASKPPLPAAKKTYKWEISEDAANTNAAAANASRPSLAGLFGNVKPSDDGNVLSAIAQKK